MSTFYLRPYYPLAARIADQVRALPADQWAVIGFYDLGDGELEPMTPRTTDLSDLQPGEVGMLVIAGEWLAEFDAEQDPHWPDDVDEPEQRYPHPMEIWT